MPSTFFGLNIASSGLSAFQTSINTTANNIANVQTAGYTRQSTTLESKDPLRVYTRYGSTGTGVDAVKITQERNLYYDAKYWGNNSSAGYFDQKLYYLNQVEDILRDDSTQDGFTTIFSKMFNSLDTLKTMGEDESVRNQFIHQAQSLCTYFNAMSQALTSLQEDCNEEIKSTVSSINAISQKIAMLNKEINMIEVRGGTANELRDKRASLIDELSELVNVETQEFPVRNSNGQDLGGTNYRVIINGQVLVDGNDYRTLSCTTSEYKRNLTDAEGMYSISWDDTGMDFAATTSTAGGRLKALFAVRDGNNNDNFRGTVESMQGKTLKLNNLSITDINALNIPDKGQLRLGNTYYTYESWSITVTEDGMQSIEFTMTEEYTGSDDALKGMTAICSEAVDAMGVPYYQAQINEFLRNFVQAFNDIEKKGVDLKGNPMGSFFVGESPTGEIYELDDYYKNMEAIAEAKENNEPYEYTFSSADDTYYWITSSTVEVNAKSLQDPSYFSTSSEIINGVAKYDIVEQLLPLQKEVTMFRGDNAESFLETLISDITVDVKKMDINATNYFNLKVTIGNQRTSVSGVDEDEEALNLIKFQNAYNLASKMISVMAEIYNKLINETGVT